jgi:hypothetical protein
MKQIVMLIGGESRAAGGGVNDSGWGWFRNVAVAEFRNLRWVTVQTAPRHYPF